MKTIDIITSNNVTIRYELGSILQRFVALLLDAVILGAYYMLMAIPIAMLLGMDQGYDADMDISATAYLFTSMLKSFIAVLLLIPLFFYHFLCEYFFAGQTVGKMAMGLRVMKLNGQIPTLTDYFLRWSFQLVDMWMTVCSIGFLSASSSDKNQRLGDMVANTTVIRLNSTLNYSIKDILTIKTSDNYEPVYPQVTRFTDEDMLLIKNAIDRVRKFPNKKHRSLIIELAKKSQDLLNIAELPKNKLAFLKTLLQDYIVLTRS